MNTDHLNKVGFLRVLNEEETIIPCLLSVAPALDHVVILWSDTSDRSIELAGDWKNYLWEHHRCELSFLRYPYHIVPPHSVDDLRNVPVENRIDTYLNFGMDYITNLYNGRDYAVWKVDGDQVYFPDRIREAFDMLDGPDDCIGLKGHNTLVHEGRLMVYKPKPVNGGNDCLICGMDNLPRYDVQAPYEVDAIPHPRVRFYRELCWVHFMKKARYGNVIREFQDNEIIPITGNKDLLQAYESTVLPLIKQSGSIYSGLSYM